MILIVCVDDHNGMMFNHRRQSQDRILRGDILELTEGKIISALINLLLRTVKISEKFLLIRERSWKAGHFIIVRSCGSIQGFPTMILLTQK